MHLRGLISEKTGLDTSKTTASACCAAAAPEPASVAVSSPEPEQPQASVARSSAKVNACGRLGYIDPS